MTKLDEFKNFISKNPNISDYVRKNKVTWQSLYELYDLYGSNNEIWDKYRTKQVIDTQSIKGIINLLKTVDLDALEDNISSIQKAVSLVSELTTKEEKEEIKNPKEEKINSLYGDKNGL